MLIFLERYRMCAARRRRSTSRVLSALIYQFRPAYALKTCIDHHKADLIFASVPYKILHTFQIPVFQKIAEIDADFTNA